MKRRILMVLSAGMLMLSLVGCGEVVEQTGGAESVSESSQWSGRASGEDAAAMERILETAKQRICSDLGECLDVVRSMLVGKS